MGVRLEEVDKFPFSILRTAPFIEKLEIHVSSVLDFYLPIDILLFGTMFYFIHGGLCYTSYSWDEYRISMSHASELVI
jgi:hypothetical protein